MCLRRARSASKEGCGAVHRVGGAHHLVELLDGPARSVAHPVEIAGLGELAQQTRHVAGHVGIVQTQLAFIAVAHRLLEERFERMSLRCIHTSRARNRKDFPCPVTAASASNRPSCEAAAVPWMRAGNVPAATLIHMSVTLRLSE